MSTNKTQNYQLTLWDYGDEDFSPKTAREDWGANFTKLDAALKAEETTRISSLAGLETVLAGKISLVLGNYVGEQSSSSFGSRRFELGFRPKAVVLSTADTMNTSILAIDRTVSGARFLVIDDTGFTVYHGNYDTDKADRNYVYIAFR